MGARVKTSRDAFSQTLLASDFIEVGKIVLWLRGPDESDERQCLLASPPTSSLIRAMW